MADRWTVIINEKNLVDALQPALSLELERMKAELKRRAELPVDTITKGITHIVTELFGKEASRGVILNGINESLSDVLNEGGWMEFGASNPLDRGEIGKFFEKDVFNMSPNSDPRADIRAIYKTDQGEELLIETELKTMLNYQDKISIGSISVLKDIVDSIKDERDVQRYKHNIILYKILLKMQNFVLARARAMNENGKNYVSFAEFTFYSGIIVEYVERVIGEFFETDARRKSVGNLFKIKEKTREAQPARAGFETEGLITFELQLNYKDLITSERMSVNGERVMVENYKKMYRNKASLFNDPETRKQFFAIARKIAKMAGKDFL